MSQSEKHDVFVGNVAFNAKQEDLHEYFSTVGKVKTVRIMTDKESGKPKGFAFVEFYDANTALTAIQQLNATQLHGKTVDLFLFFTPLVISFIFNLDAFPFQLKVHIAANTNLHEVAKKAGIRIVENPSEQEIQAYVRSKPLHELWDAIEAMKKLAEEDKDACRKLLEAHPQLVYALTDIQVK